VCDCQGTRKTSSYRCTRRHEESGQNLNLKFKMFLSSDKNLASLQPRNMTFAIPRQVSEFASGMIETRSEDSVPPTKTLFFKCFVNSQMKKQAHFQLLLRLSKTEGRHIRFAAGTLSSLKTGNRKKKAPRVPHPKAHS